ncbi:MAG: hypothetical protein HY698_19250 [Deltaproteobacteria bacterium]|nr:hypothetical protein [Deltaproteobacteria bacterium]
MNEPRSLFGSSPPKVASIRGKLRDASAHEPRDGSWLQGAFEAAVPEAPDEEAEKQKEEERLARELEQLRETQAQVEATLARYLDGIAKLEQVARTMPDAHARDAVELAFVIAKAIVGKELAVDRKQAISMVLEALKHVEGQRDVTVRLNQTDLQYLREHHPDLVGSPLVTFIEDPRLAMGGCVVETPKRIVDASVETRLSLVQARLTDMFLRGVEQKP